MLTKLLRMFKNYAALLLLFTTFYCNSQQELLSDFRQHNLTHLNASLLNPTFSIDRNNPRSATLWSRWQNQQPDADPTTLYFTYNQLVGNSMGIGISFFQNNTTNYQDTGGIINFAFGIPMGEQTNVFFGANILTYQRSFNQTVNNVENNIVAQLSPGIRIQTGGLNLGFTVENALNYNFTLKEREPNYRILNTLFSYDFKIANAILRPQTYVKSIPEQDFQYGANLLLLHTKYWVQGGYNNFYGPSGGIGVTLFKKLSLGALMELDLTDNLPTNSSQTFELIASFKFDKQTYKQEEKEEEEFKEKLDAEALKQEIARRDSLNSIAEVKRLAMIQRRRLDSIQKERQKQLAEALEKAKQDSIARVAREKEAMLMENEKYEEVNDVEGLEPGYYLIANVFGTKKFLDKFIYTLKQKGLEPKYFYRSLNGYNYVYLARYDTLWEARAALKNNLAGQYYDELWVFRVKN